MNIDLTPELAEFVAQKIKNGKYVSENDVVLAGLRLLREREGYTEWLRKEIAIGVEQADRGELEPLDIDAIVAEVDQMLAKQKEAG